jgi:hypothetical protein
MGRILEDLKNGELMTMYTFFVKKLKLGPYIALERPSFAW